MTRIEAGEFLDMAELLPDHQGPATTEPLPKPSKQCHDVSNILEWIRCFSAYVAVMIPPCGTLPSRAGPDLCAASSASVSRIPQQNVSGHLLTKGPIPQELSPSIKLQLNQSPPTLPHHDDVEYVCCITMSQLHGCSLPYCKFEHILLPVC